MSGEYKKIKIFISSPSDLQQERKIARRVIETVENSIGNNLKITLEIKDWQTLPPGAFKNSPQDYINTMIGSYDIYIGIMGKRFGNKTEKAESGTVEEFERAYSKWRLNGKPEIMFYFKNLNTSPKNAEETKQLLQVLRFQEGLSSRVLWKTYGKPGDFERLLREDLQSKLQEMKRKPIARKSEDDTVSIKPTLPSYTNLNEMIEKRKITKISSSFIPGKKPSLSKFDRFRIQTTEGWVKKGGSDGKYKMTFNFVYVIEDPIRPFGIQIGETRSMRKQGHPNAIPDLTNLDLASIQNMYPFLQVTGFKWIRMVLAELSTDQKILDFIQNEDPDKEVKEIAAKNPSSSNELQKKECIFCQDSFRKERLQAADSGKTIIINNDFPYGPYFHHIVFPEKAIHAWEEMELEDIYDLNLTLWKFLRLQRIKNIWKTKDPKGVFIGMNSTIRHLVMGSKTLTSAGASIPHIHKQAWGMYPGGNILGDHLKRICEFYRDKNIDYLGAYLEYLKYKKMVLFEDENVALYVPFGQISIHEMQIMVKRGGACNYLDLEEKEIKSFSRAETMAFKLMKRMGIQSFNEVMISLPFEEKNDCFRLITCFVTREVDFAVSELNQLFVVDKHPEDTIKMMGPLERKTIQCISKERV
jgi:galactose-1-phosphate uridylyltransferase